MKLFDMHMVIGLAVALLGTIFVAFILSYLYPVVIGGADVLQYLSASLHGNPDGWRLVLAVFAVASAVTIVVFVIVAAVAFGPLLRLFPRLANGGVYTYLLLGIGVSLVVLAVGWIVEFLFGLLVGGDYFFMQLAVIVDGPVATVMFWFVDKKIRDGRRKAA